MIDSGKVGEVLVSIDGVPKWIPFDFYMAAEKAANNIKQKMYRLYFGIPDGRDTYESYIENLKDQDVS